MVKMLLFYIILWLKVSFVISRAEMELISKNYYKDVFKFCFSRLNEDDAKDVTQEVFVTLQEKKEKLKYGDGIKYWLLDVASKKIYEEYRAKQKNYYDELAEGDLTVDSIESLFEENQYSDEKIQQLKQLILSKLKEEEFTLYIKAVNEHKGYKQIAEEMGLSYDAAKARFTRLRKKLKRAAKLATTPVGLLILKLFF